jgi:hypothetical protein|tara:strand:- start:101 stop:436 length:336 start_codon:yes stop_codon:yes gene_type:complete
MLSDHIEQIARLLRKNANHHNGRLQLTDKTTDILLSNLQFLSDDLRRYEDAELCADVESPAIAAIMRELGSVTANFDASEDCDTEPTSSPADPLSNKSTQENSNGKPETTD